MLPVAILAGGLATRLRPATEKIPKSLLEVNGEPFIAHQAFRTEFVEVAPGQAAGVHQVARGISGGKEKIYMELQMYVGAPESKDQIELRGEPNLAFTIPGGTHGDIATAALVVNAIPAILATPAGLKTSRDLPLCFFPPTAKP